MAVLPSHGKLMKNDLNANFPGWQSDVVEAVFLRIYWLVLKVSWDDRSILPLQHLPQDIFLWPSKVFPPR